VHLKLEWGKGKELSERGGRVILETEEMSCTNPKVGSMWAMAADRASGMGSMNGGGLSGDLQVAAESVKQVKCAKASQQEYLPCQALEMCLVVQNRM